MFVAVRDVTLFQAGEDSLRAGLARVGVAWVEVGVTRELRVPGLEDSLEVGVSAATAGEAAAVAAAYREAGVGVCALMVANNFNAPDGEAEGAHIVRAVGVAEALGAPVVRLDGAMSGLERLSRRRRIGLCARALEEVLEATSDSAVVLAVENHGRQGNDCLWLEGLLAAVPTPRVALTLDPANLYWAGYPLAQVYELVESFAPRVAHVHAKNLTYPPAVREQRRPVGWEYGCCVCPLAEGDVDYARIARLLAAAGYRGALANEDESLAKYRPAERPELLRRGVRYLEAAVGAVGETERAGKASKEE
jgi:sugar phosphate isomerase/epimerase